MGKGEKAAPHVTSQDRVKALPLARLKEHAAEVEVLPDALGGNKSFALDVRLGTACSCPGLTRDKLLKSQTLWSMTAFSQHYNPSWQECSTLKEDLRRL